MQGLIWGATLCSSKPFWLMDVKVYIKLTVQMNIL